MIFKFFRERKRKKEENKRLEEMRQEMNAHLLSAYCLEYHRDKKPTGGWCVGQYRIDVYDTLFHLPLFNISIVDYDHTGKEIGSIMVYKDDVLYEGSWYYDVVIYLKNLVDKRNIAANAEYREKKKAIDGMVKIYNLKKVEKGD